MGRLCCECVRELQNKEKVLSMGEHLDEKWGM